ncbi:unnamed protein product [Calicophoron daubneyi]|uniref:L-type lectin-like domain-containing protein n=1 Tax=Calicophoron daubneyi TaxID=300641 RepID=A0AAV2TQT9_CALDB
MYTSKHKISARLYLTLLIWMSVQAASAPDRSQHKRLHQEHSLFRPMPSEPNLWNLGGTARFDDGVLNLVPMRTRVAGVAWNGIPVDYCNWELNIWFSVKTKYRSGDGWALFYTEEPITEVELDPYKNAMGGPNDYRGIALIFDSHNNYFRDGNFPRLYPVLLNGDYKYSHYHNGWYQRPYSCPYQCVNGQCKIRFEYWNRNLHMTAMNWRGDELCHRGSSNVVLPAGGYFSFTAFNNYQRESVDILEFKVEEILDGSECFDRDGEKPKWDHDTY